MGCAPSTGNRRVAQKQMQQVDERFAPPPPIPVSIGNGVRRRHDVQQTVIFIFGGPGSQKGLIIEDLMQHFDFISINVEDIVFTYLPNKVANTVSTTSEIQEALKKDTGILSIDWIFSMISAKLSTSVSQRFIIDIVPALSTIIRADSFRQKNHERSLEQFERRHPVMLALELQVADESSLLDKNGNETRPDEKKLSPEMSQFMKGIDEADKGRLEKRLDSYHQCANSFLEYFSKTRRVVKLSLNAPALPNVVSTVRATFHEIGFSSQKSISAVVVFAINDDTLEDIDFAFYKMRKMKLSEIVKGKDEPLTSQIQGIQKHIERTAATNENFVVVLDTLNNTDNPKSKKINFMERKMAYLDEFIKDKLDRAPTARVKVSVNAISSTNDQVLLFMEPFPTRLAVKIGLIFTDTRAMSSATYSPTRLDS